MAKLQVRKQKYMKVAIKFEGGDEDIRKTI